jgi:hypothetical protein
MVMARKIKNPSFNSDSKKLEVLVALLGSRFGDILCRINIYKFIIDKEIKNVRKKTTK